MMRYIISAPSTLSGKIKLPASKSISNRALILNALSECPYPVENLSDSDDTKVMINAFISENNEINIGAAGTAMRFLTAYLSQKQGTWTITGTERMKNRPIGILVDALRKLGANIEYLEKEGFPPLKIEGNKLTGGIIDLDGSVSSQYISALMMIAPLMEKGLIINLKGNIISKPYIQMTKQMMEDFGIKLEVEGNKVTIPPQSYTPVNYMVESDWSAASYWYEMLFLSDDKNAQIKLTGLKDKSPQGDSRLTDLFNMLGITTSFDDEGALISKFNKHSDAFNYSFVDEPDLAQTFVVACCMKNIPFRFTGLQSLKIKETDRILALKTELGKLGYDISDKEDSIIEWDGNSQIITSSVTIDTYEDHRMAMAFAPVAIVKGQIIINDPEVVSKSYPGYWDDLKAIGFEIKADFSTSNKV